MVSDMPELPFFPKYEVEYFYDNSLCIVWFESNFSQAYYNVHKTNRGSNACTLIAVLMAAKCHKFNLLVHYPFHCLNMSMIQLFAISMLEGNKIHESLKLKNQLKHINLNVPEAINFGGSDMDGIVEWKSEVFMQPLVTSLYENIKTNWRLWLGSDIQRENYTLYIILVADSRTVLFILQLKTESVALIDSHQHSGDKGGCMAITELAKMKFMCHWYSDMLYKFYRSTPQIYELSFLYFSSHFK
ncbi:unnamed protein product [Psylliodes chrysocephalus]|uniref:Uncharacterized protein n=1 Tax=Psylliodes chrysocephalus TaxID=3402493 RepID=A0A9P0D9F1_9CUCU|nr:unnamed protein product [Psylliodes chrysocephala]